MRDNQSRFNAGQLVLVVALLVIILDQILKIWVKTSFAIGEQREITSWFKLVFIENNGMAFGWEFGSKFFLTLFRIVFVGVLVYFIIKLRKTTVLKTGFIICVALILAGALGNIIDCLFYGLIFDYGSFFYGRVVDMLYFPLVEFNWPEWVPAIGGKHFLFFSPIFNLADAAISVGIICIIVFYSKQLNLAYSLIKGKKEDNGIKGK